MKAKDAIPDNAEFGCSAIVTVTLEVRGQGHWGGDATVAEVMRIGGRETLNGIENMIREYAGHERIRIVGEPQIGAVTWARSK